MAERLGQHVSYRLGWSYLVRLTQSPQAPRPPHAHTDAAAQDTVNKSSGRA